jgi:hypothetical protein
MQTKPRIITAYTYPVAPFPGFWQAWDDRFGADDSPYGMGATEQEAIDDLRAQLEAEA